MTQDLDQGPASFDVNVLDPDGFATAKEHIMALCVRAMTLCGALLMQLASS